MSGSSETRKMPVSRSCVSLAGEMLLDDVLLNRDMSGIHHLADRAIYTPGGLVINGFDNPVTDAMHDDSLHINMLSDVSIHNPAYFKTAHQ